MATINQGYMGWATVFGAKTRFSTADIAVRQTPEIPDLVMGDWDHDAWHYGPIAIDGSMSGPVTERFVGGAGSIWESATKRSEPCGTLASGSGNIDLNYYCGPGGGRNQRLFKACLIDSMSFSCTAGDVANFSINFIGAEDDHPWGNYGGRYQEPEKIVTWDAIKLSGDAIDTGVQSFEFTINNNIEVVYAMHEDANFFPFALVPGLRTLTGSLSIFNIPSGDFGADSYYLYDANTPHSLEVDIAGTAFTIPCAFHRIEPQSAVGPIVTTVGFTSVGSLATLDA